MWLGADASRLQTHLWIGRGRLHAHLGCVAQPEVGRGSVHAHLRPTWGWAWTRPAQLGCGRVQPNLGVGVGVDARPNLKLGVHHVAVGLP